MENDIEELAKIPIEEIDQPKLSKDDIDVRLKWLGLFHRRKNQCISIFNVKTQLGRNGRFMMRLNLPNGVTTSGQTRYLASVIRKYGEEGCADITTRQNWQIRGVVLPDVPEILKGVAEVVLTSLQSGMDNVRNVVGNPLARIDPEEMVDTRPYTNLLTQFITGNSHGNPAVSNLYSKRKYDTCWIQFLLTIRDSRPDPTKWKYTGFVVEITSKGNTPNFFQAAGTYCTSPSCNSAIIMPIFGLLVDEQQDQPV